MRASAATRANHQGRSEVLPYPILWFKNLTEPESCSVGTIILLLGYFLPRNVRVETRIYLADAKNAGSPSTSPSVARISATQRALGIPAMFISGIPLFIVYPGPPGPMEGRVFGIAAFGFLSALNHAHVENHAVDTLGGLRWAFTSTTDGRRERR